MTSPATLTLTKGFTSSAEFFAWYEQQEGRYEYVDGTAIAMAGPSIRHGAIEVNLLSGLKAALQDRPCRVLPAGVMISVREGQGYRHADASIVCGEPQFDPQGALVNPTVLIEVLSETTERADRGAKWHEYRLIPSLRDYLLVSQREVSVDHFQRRGDLWVSLEAYRGAHDVIQLSDGANLPLSQIYEGVWSLPSDQ